MKAIEEYFDMELYMFSILYKMVLTFNSVDKTLVCDVTVLSCGTVYYEAQGDSVLFFCTLNKNKGNFLT